MTTGESIRAQDQEAVRLSADEDASAAAFDGASDPTVSQVPEWRRHLTSEEARDLDGFTIQIDALTRQRKDLASRRRAAIDRWDRATAQELRSRIGVIDRQRRQARAERQLIVNRGTARKRKKDKQCLSTERRQTTSSPTR